MEKFLKGVGSKLLQEIEDQEPVYFYERLDLLTNIGDNVVRGRAVWAPRNVALLFFHPTPHNFYKGAKTEIATYNKDGTVADEKTITGPIDQQIESTLFFILETTKEEACHAFVAYPIKALREAVVNAFHHRGYEECDSNPTMIHIRPDCIEVTSYPGPDPCLKVEHFSDKNKVPYVPARNRRIAEFLKDRRLAEGRFTGVRTIFKTMRNNKNPKPEFNFGPSHFTVTLPGHPKYIVYSLLREVDYLCTKGDKHEAVKCLKGFLDDNLTEEHSYFGSDMLISKLLELHENDMSHPSIQPYMSHVTETLKKRIPLVTELRKWCAEEGTQDISVGVEIIKELVKEGAKYEELQAAVTKAVTLSKTKSGSKEQKLKAVQNAHQLFEAMGEVTQTDGYAAFQFACCKFNLYMISTNIPEVRKRTHPLPYLSEAEDYVNKAMQLTSEGYKRDLANQYRLLGYIHSQLLWHKKSTGQKVTDFYDYARRYNPEIKINHIYIPPEYRSKYRLTDSPKGDNSFEWTVNLGFPMHQLTF